MPSTYLQKFAVVGRNGMRELVFGLAGTAHAFERRAEAKDIGRRFHRRVSMSDYDFIVADSGTLSSKSCIGRGLSETAGERLRQPSGETWINVGQQ